FTSQFIPGGTAEQSRWFNDLERVSATPEMMERFVIEMSTINIADLLPQVKAPTLVTHCTGDVRVPFAVGQEIAAGIPAAKFLPFDERKSYFFGAGPRHGDFLRRGCLVPRRSAVQRRATRDDNV